LKAHKGRIDAVVRPTLAAVDTRAAAPWSFISKR
jgi:hypothetical protein